MSKLLKFSISLFLLLNLTACGKHLNDATLPLDVKVGGTYYSQMALQYEKGRHLTTNYRRGALISINTPVMLAGIDTKTIDIEVLPSHSKLRIENVEKHTGDSSVQAFRKLFNKNKVDLNQFSKFEQENILQGKVSEGMRKKAVLAAIGYPPITETPVLEGSQWTYWSSRFNRFIVHFENDKVVKIQD